MLSAVIVAGQIAITSFGPPLSPQEAVRVLRASRSISDRTDVPSLGTLPPPRAAAIRSSAVDGPFGPFPPFANWRPLNCCSRYVIRLPRRVR